MSLIALHLEVILTLSHNVVNKQDATDTAVAKEQALTTLHSVVAEVLVGEQARHCNDQ
jgi:hypothetical protein